MSKPWDCIRAELSKPPIGAGVWRTTRSNYPAGLKVQIAGLTSDGLCGFAIRDEERDLPSWGDVLLTPQDAREIGEFLIELAEQGGA